MSRERPQGWYPLLLATASIGIANSVVFPLLSDLQDAYGFSSGSLGIIAGSGFLVGLVGQIVLVPLADLEIDDPDRFDEGAEVAVRLHLEALNDGIVVTGEVRVPWHGTCRRCLESTSGEAVSEVHELYQRTLTDPDAFEIVGGQLDLRPATRELVLLEIGRAHV